jgi:HTH-type transcriptional regulator/antitoxin HigA
MIGKHPQRFAAATRGMIRQLEDELRDYDHLKSGKLILPNVERLDQIAPFIATMRIAKGVSQTELANRLGVSKQVVSRCEETEYQTVAISRLQDSRRNRHKNIRDSEGVEVSSLRTGHSAMVSCNVIFKREACVLRL